MHQMILHWIRVVKLRGPQSERTTRMHATADAVDLFSRLALAASVTRNRFVFTSVTRMHRRHHCPPHHCQPHHRYIKPEGMKPNAHYHNPVTINDVFIPIRAYIPAIKPEKEGTGFPLL